MERQKQVKMEGVVTKQKNKT